jgi:DNA modification methylase
VNGYSATIAFQGWRNFKEAFAPELVERAINETGKVRHVIDPFGGSGTTALAAQFLGAKPTTIEVNPFLADLRDSMEVNSDQGLVS